jgi:nicotinate-nucleotide adenylyltransferase
MKKVALFLGSFNPVHIGHLALCNYIAEYCGVDEVRFVLSPQNPLKHRNDLLADNLRLEMLNIAVEGYSKFKVDEVELHLPLPSYTCVTLRHLVQSEPDVEFILIMGGDNLDIFRQWREYEWIMSNFHIWVYPRLGASNIVPDDFCNMKCIKAPIIEVSSSFIRKAISDGHDVRYFLPNSVCNFVSEHNLYR